jgi:paraquat-inducible protein A
MQKAKDASYLMACHECDLLHRLGTLSEGQVAVCVRCGAVLHQKKPNSFDRSLALTIAGLILFAMANAYPLIAIKSGSLQQATTLLGSVHVLLGAGVWHIALLVFLTAILFPFLELVLMFIVLVSLKMKKQVRNLPLMLVFVQAIRPWGMMEVFMLGILVSVVKLVKMVKVIPGISLYALAVLIFVIAAITTTFDTNEAWDTLKGDQ